MLERLFIIFFLVCFFSCSPRIKMRAGPVDNRLVQTHQRDECSGKTKFVEYSIQVGAFQSFNNADAYSRKLDQYVDAFSFKDSDGLFKVRFGNYSSQDDAHKKARQLESMNIIDEYFLVLPGKYKNKNMQALRIRDKIVNKAEKYIGVQYRWGGEDSVTGFDCSGLTSSVYRESGIMLPRTSREQHKTGMFVLKKDLKKGDLVFFKIRGRTVSHVGIYVGRSKFIHAPSKGKTVCYQALNSSYYRDRYAGARTYLN